MIANLPQHPTEIQQAMEHGWIEGTKDLPPRTGKTTLALVDATHPLWGRTDAKEGRRYLFVRIEPDRPGGSPYEGWGLLYTTAGHEHEAQEIEAVAFRLGRSFREYARNFGD